MAEVLLIHHIQGLTDGVRRSPTTCGPVGTPCTTPDLYDGHTFATIEEGFAHQKGVDGDALIDAVVADLPAGLVYAGFSWGVPRAQRLAQTRPGAKGALLYESCIPITGESAFGPWPDGVPCRSTARRATSSSQEDLPPPASWWVRRAGAGQLFMYPGDAHLFADRSLPSYDARRRPRHCSAAWPSSTVCRGRLARVRILARVVATLGLVRW